MKPIVGEIDYPDMSPEEINRYMREAEKMRAVACREMVESMGKAVGHAAMELTRAVRRFVSDHVFHGAVGAR